MNVEQVESLHEEVDYDFIVVVMPIVAAYGRVSREEDVVEDEVEATY